MCKVKREDRVYAVGMDAKGEYMVVGGRDKKIAMYDVDRGEGRANPTAPVDAMLQWEVMSEDFVYCVALSHDMQVRAPALPHRRPPMPPPSLPHPPPRRPHLVVHAMPSPFLLL